MRESLKAGVKAIGRRAGVDIGRARPDNSSFRRMQLFRHIGVDLVLDAGANVGRYANHMRYGGYEGRMVSFEPVPDTFAELSERAADDPLWETRQLALSDSDGTANMNIASMSTVSSLLPMRDWTREQDPDKWGYVDTTEVAIARLDTIADDVLGTSESVWLKLDVQGSERKALTGAAETLSRVAAVEAELSLVPLYEGEATFLDIAGLLAESGFEMVGIDSELADPATGLVLQVNGIFMREPDWPR